MPGACQTLSVTSHAEQAWAKRWEVDGGEQRLCDREHWRLAQARIHSGQDVPPCRCDVSKKLARIMRCNSILSCMPDAACPCTRFQRRGCATPCAAGGCTHDAGTHCRGARPPWVRRAWGEQRALRGGDVPEKQACKMKCDSCTICMPDTGMQNEV